MKILAGSMDSLAMEAEIEEVDGDRVYGKFRFWILGSAVGNWRDFVDLDGVVRWIRDLVDSRRDRREARLDGCSKEDVFRLVVDPVMARSMEHGNDPAIEDAFTRFFISHVGMSSFDAYDLLLVEEEDGAQRILWRRADGAISEAYLRSGEVERVAKEFVEKSSSLFRLS